MRVRMEYGCLHTVLGSSYLKTARARWSSKRTEWRRPENPNRTNVRAPHTLLFVDTGTERQQRRDSLRWGHSLLRHRRDIIHLRSSFARSHSGSASASASASVGASPAGGAAEAVDEDHDAESELAHPHPHPHPRHRPSIQHGGHEQSYHHSHPMSAVCPEQEGK
jgi:hypothetical protein